jgi:TonB family protein
MSKRFKSRAAISLLIVSASWIMCAQTTNGSGKKCLPPQVTYSPEPPPSHYPLKDSALAVLNVLVDEKGQVLDPKVVKSSGSDEFDHDAMGAVQKWRFKPASCDGKPIPTRMKLQISSKVTK